MSSAQHVDINDVSFPLAIQLERPAIALPSPTRDSSLLRAGLLTICICTALLGRLCFWPLPLDGDGSMFAYMGKLITLGGRFQHDIIDNKFPSVGLFMSLPWRLFGSSGHAYLILQITMSFVGSWLLARSASRTFGAYAARPTLLAALLLLNFTFAVNGGFQLETVQAFFSILAAVAALEALNSADARDAFTAGVAAGVAVMLKPTGAAVLAAFAIASLLRYARQPRQLTSLAVAVACGFALPAATTLAYLLAADNLRDMPGLYRQISTYASQSHWDLADLIKPACVAVVIGFPLFVRGWIFRRDRLAAPVTRNRTYFIFVISWLALELLGVVLQRRMYAYHFLVLAPPAALLFGLLPRQDRTLPTAAALAMLMALSICSSLNVFRDLQHKAREPDVAAYLRSRTLPGDYIWRDRVMSVLLETNLRSGSRMPMTYLFANSDQSPLLYSQTMLADFSARRPVYILLPADLDHYVDFYSHHLKDLAASPLRQANFVIAWHNIERYVNAHYSPQARLGDEMVYHRIDR